MKVATALVKNPKHTPKQKFIYEKLNEKNIQVFSAGTLLNSTKKEMKVDRINVTKPYGMTSY
jgi:predicted house-cleaning NTP pyrophosphatase (Maf/HAM1 superfamily)